MKTQQKQAVAAAVESAACLCDAISDAISERGNRSSEAMLADILLQEALEKSIEAEKLLTTIKTCIN